MFSVCLLFYGTLALLFFPMLGSAEDDLAQLSYYRGYVLWKEQLDRPGISCRLEDVIEGMRAAQRGTELQTDDLEELVTQLQQKVLSKQQLENLARAEKFLLALEQDKDVFEVCKGKLFYKRLAVGSGEEVVLADSAPVLVYSAKILEHDKEQEFLGLEESMPILLSTTIPGFAQGVVGMKVGEKRRLYIHPDLAYEGDGWVVGPNQLMIFDVEVIALH